VAPVRVAHRWLVRWRISQRDDPFPDHARCAYPVLATDPKLIDAGIGRIARALINQLRA
jgi:hypothetical protein